MLRALALTLGSDMFDQLGLRVPDMGRNGRWMKQSVSKRNEAWKGDWGYVKSFPAYKGQYGSWRGENVITIESDRLWGFEGANVEQSLSQWEATVGERAAADLTDANVPRDKWGEFKGWVPDDNVFVDVAKVGRAVFEYNRREQRRD